MEPIEIDYSVCSALVVDGNPNSRSIAVRQLRELGMRQIAQCTRTSEARRQLENQRFDFVLCELYFSDESTSGQDMLDDLRRNQLLPFSTVFIMITGEATYSKVAEAAESALDGYLLKPHRAAQLEERLHVARARKLSLQEIFDAIDAQEFERAAGLCLQRFESKGLFWLYAARIGAELLLRLERFDQAQTLYKAVVAARTLPWAKLGIARAQLEAGQVSLASTTLEKLIGEDPNFADAYDVMGRAQFELGQFDKALATFKMASMLTPSSISRLQNVAMMTFYAGDHGDAERLLERTTRLGLESKMFDSQTLVLLAFSRLELEDRRGLQRCLDDFARLCERNPDNARMVRLRAFATAIAQLQKQELDEVRATVQELAHLVLTPDFDFESAGNLIALLTRMASRGMHMQEATRTVEALGLRFCSNRAVSELLAACSKGNEAYVASIHAAHDQVLSQAEAAITLSMSGKPGEAVRQLLDLATESLNVRLIDNAYQLLAKHGEKLEGTEALRKHALDLRRRAGAGNRKVSLGNQRRQAGGVVLRSTARITPDQIPPGPALAL